MERARKGILQTYTVRYAMKGFNSTQFRDLVKRVLFRIKLYSPAAEDLICGTAAVESDFGYFLRQFPEGPGIGIFQIEINTEHDIWNNYLEYRPERVKDIITVSGVTNPSTWSLETNIAYQIAMCRIHYRRVSEPLPEAGDIKKLSKYWKDYFNTHLGKGDTRDFYDKYLLYC